MFSTELITPTGDPNIDAILGLTQWTSTELTYNFLTTGNFFTGYHRFNTEQQNATRAVFDQIESFTNLTFTETSASDAVITFGFADLSGIAAGIGIPPSDRPESGEVWVHTSFEDADYSLGTMGQFLLMHEIGHTLGLWHGHEPLPYGELDHDVDSGGYTVMTYESNGNATSDHPQTFMMLDIAALQHLYGANYNHNSSDTVYSWDNLTGEMFINGEGQGEPKDGKILLTVWDGGGEDTFDFSNTINDTEIDLRPGSWSTYDEDKLAEFVFNDYEERTTTIENAHGNIATALLFEGNTASLIENAVGGWGDDRINGNQADNELYGNRGNDRLYGHEGNDYLEGGRGVDTLNGGDGEDRLYGGDDRDYLYGGNDNDRLYGEDGNDRLYGQNGDDRLYGNDGDDYLTGQSGIDRLYGGNGDDYMLGGGSTDYLYGQSGNDNLRGNSGNDFLYGSYGSDKLYGGTGNDHLDGGRDNDILHGGDGADYMNGGTGDDIMTGGLGRDTFVISNYYDNDDTITDFEVGTDILDLRNTEIDSVRELYYSASEERGNVVINIGSDDTLTLEDTSLFDLVVNGDFIF